MDDFFKGLGFLLRGVRHLATKGLKRFVLLPIAFNFLVFLGLFYLASHYLFPYASGYLELLPSWLSFLGGVFFIVFVISFFLLFLSLFTVLFNLIAAPFNGILAEKAQHILYQSTIPSLSFTEITVRSIKRQGKFLGYFLSRFIGMCLLFFVPFVQPVYPLIWFLFNAWMLGFQYQDFAMDNNLISFDAMRDKLRGKRFLSFGFGSFINLASFIPLLNVLVMPAAVIGGVMMYCEENTGSVPLPPKKEKPER